MRRQDNNAAVRFSLFDLLLLMTCAALACFFSAHDGTVLGALLMITSVSLRTAVVDFSLIGSFATASTMFFGIPTLFLMLFWSIAS